MQDNRTIEKLRQRQIKNMMTSLLLSLGTPMIVSGDECRRTQRGNNNAYCQDNVISWFNWRLVQKYSGMGRFIRNIIQFRKQQPTMRMPHFLSGQHTPDHEWPDVSWYRPTGQSMHWDGSESSLICLRPAVQDPNYPDLEPVDILLFLHPGVNTRTFRAPELVRKRKWLMFFDTAAPSPHDIYPDLDGPQLPEDGEIILEQRCIRCYISHPVKEEEPQTIV